MPSITLLGAVAAGGAIGASLRFLINLWATSTFGLGFPAGTLIVNILGAFAMGALVETFALAWTPPRAIQAMLTTGLLGALTTFSTFSLDLVYLAREDRLVAAGLYLAASVTLSIAALVIGMRAVRLVVV